MKSLKYLITVVVFLLCFSLNGELYQAHLQTFSNDYFYFECSATNQTNVYTDVISAAETCGQDIFAVNRSDLDAFHSRLTIYTSDLSKQAMEKRFGIAEGEASSFFSGTTEVIYRPLEELDLEYDAVRYYFTGSKDDVLRIRQIVSKRVGTSYVHRESKSGTETIVYVAWILVFGFLLLLSWLDIHFSRKAVFLRISMGASVGTKIWTCILTDLLVDITIFAVSYGLVGNYIDCSFKINAVIPLFFLFLFVNSLLYLSFVRGDYKEIIYGANIDRKLLPNAYLLKALVLILLVISGSCTMALINENAAWLRNYQKVDRLEGYYTLRLTHPETGADLSADDDEARGCRETRLFLEAYRAKKVLLAIPNGTIRGDEIPTVVVNDVALPKVLSNPTEFQARSADFTVFVPKEIADEVDENKIKQAAQLGADYFGLSWDMQFFGAKGYSYEMAPYPTTELLCFDLREESKLPYGFAILKDPVIVCCNLTPEQIDTLIDAGTTAHYESRWASLMFEGDDAAIFSAEVTRELRELSFHSVVTQCGQYKSSLLRELFVNVALSLVLLGLSIVLISVIVKLEYLVNAKEIALKRILGYSLIQRNSAAAMLNLFSIFIALVTGLILSGMYGIFDRLTLLAVCLFVCLIDAGSLIGNFLAAERKNTVHVLKGGCL